MQNRKWFDTSTVEGLKRLEMLVAYLMVFAPAAVIGGSLFLDTSWRRPALMSAIGVFGLFLLGSKYIGYRRRQLQIQERMRREQSEGIASRQTVFHQAASQEAPWQAQDTERQAAKKRTALVRTLVGILSAALTFWFMLATGSYGRDLVQNGTFMMIGSIASVVGMIVFMILGIRELRSQRRIAALGQPLSAPISPSESPIAVPTAPIAASSVDFSAMRPQDTRLRKGPLAILVWTLGIIGLLLMTANSWALFIVGGLLFGILMTLMIRHSPIMFSGSHDSGLVGFVARNQFTLYPGISKEYRTDVVSILGLETNGWDDLDSGSRQLSGVVLGLPFSILEVSWLPAGQRAFNSIALIAIPTLPAFYDAAVRRQFETAARATGVVADIDYRVAYTYCKLMADMPDDLGTMQRAFEVIAAAAKLRAGVN